MTERFYSSTAVDTTLSGDITSTQTTINVVALNGYPSEFPYTDAIDPDTENEELVDVTGVSGTALTVVRGVAGTTKVSHAAGAVLGHRTSHRDYQEPQDHIVAVVAHGTTGDVVGTSDTQTLTNKTIDYNTNTIENLPVPTPNLATVQAVLASPYTCTTSLAPVMTTPSLAVGWWLLAISATVNIGTNSTVALVGLQGGTASYATHGPMGMNVGSGASSGFENTGALTCVLHVTVAGTVIIAASSSTAGAIVVAGNLTGYVAVQIA